MHTSGQALDTRVGFPAVFEQKHWTFQGTRPRMRLAYRMGMVGQLLAGLGIWFAGSVVLGLCLGRLMAAHDRSTPWPDARRRSTRHVA